MDLVETIKKSYNENPSSIRNFNNSNYGKYLQDELNIVRLNPPKNLKLKTLDSYIHKDSLSRIISYLHPEKIHENFGDKVLFWSILKSPYGREEKITEEANSIFNGEEKFIENMRRFLWQRFWNTDSGDIFNLWDTYRKVDKNFTDNYNLEKNLRENLRAGCNLSDEKLSKYSIVPFKVEGRSIWREKNWHDMINENETYMVNLESPASIGLMKNNKPCAFVSFIPKSYDTLLVNAFQGINKKILGEEVNLVRKVIETIPQTGLSPFYWKNLMFNIAKDFAKNNNFKRIGIQSGHNNMWTKEYFYDKKIHLPLERAVDIYDNFAESIGMKQSRNKNWYQKL